MEKICGRCAAPVSGDRCPVCGYDCSREEASAALVAGTVLDDRYVLGKVIGTGGFGITYLAYDTEMDKTVAIKEYYPKGMAVRGEDNISVEPFASLQREAFLRDMEKFRREAEILAELKNATAVVGVYGVFVQNGTAYCVMEYVHGMTVREYVAQRGRISAAQAVYVAGEAAVAFGYIHGRNVIHRDIAPDNVMIDLDGQVRLVDFGNARFFQTDDPKSMTVALKSGFAPLEQYQRRGSQGPWTDIYSLGMVLYYALTGELPEDPMTRMDDDRVFEGQLASLDARLAAVLRRMCAVKIGDRYADAESLLGGLNRTAIAPVRLL